MPPKILIAVCLFILQSSCKLQEESDTSFIFNNKEDPPPPRVEKSYRDYVKDFDAFYAVVHQQKRGKPYIKIGLYNLPQHTLINAKNCDFQFHVTSGLRGFNSRQEAESAIPALEKEILRINPKIKKLTLVPRDYDPPMFTCLKNQSNKWVPKQIDYFVKDQCISFYDYEYDFRYPINILAGDKLITSISSNFSTEYRSIETCKDGFKKEYLSGQDLINENQDSEFNSSLFREIFEEKLAEAVKTRKKRGMRFINPKP